MKTIVDNIGKDDSLNAADDSGVMAQLAYAELLRGQATPTIGTFSTPLIKDVLPGQLFHVHQKKTSGGSFNIDADMRITELTHYIGATFTTSFKVTSDVLNGNTRQPWTDYNLQMNAIRPEYQDRQATNIKAGTVDINVPRLAKDYG